MKLTLVSFIFFILISGCGENKISNKGAIQQISGGYTGIIPCADCEGINYEIELNDDMNYRERMIYIGKSDESFLATGKWKLEGTNKVTLYKKSNELSQFEFSKGDLILLDGSGKRIEGPMSEKYILKPGGMQFPVDSTHTEPLVKFDSFPMTGDTAISKSEPEVKTPPDTTSVNKTSSNSTSINGLWKLIEINGMKPDEGNYMTGIPDLEIRESDNKFSCNTGCNRVNGGVQIKGDLISFSKFLGSKMTCPGTGEKDYISTMTAVDSYIIENGVLNLIAAGKTVLKFSK